MDREQEELQFLGFFGTIKESAKIILTWTKIFTQITLTLILPLSSIFLAHIEITQLLFHKILANETELVYTREGSPENTKLSDLISSEWALFWTFKFVYFTIVLVLSLLCTSAVVYTIACIYTAKDITFGKIMSVVPKVWKRLVVTFLWNFAIVMVYNMAFAVFFVSVMALNGFRKRTIDFVIIAVLILLYMMGFVYVTLVWQLASVVSVLEDLYGMKAMRKSKVLIRGKMGISFGIFVLLVFCIVGVEELFENFVGSESGAKLGVRIGMGVLCLLLLTIVMLFGLVVQTVIYFVCKSYHHENIDKSSLADHLEVYLGEYVPLKSKDVQLEQFDV